MSYDPMILCRVVGYRPMLFATRHQDDPRSREVPGAAPPQYWGPVDNVEHIYYPPYGAMRPAYYRLAPEAQLVTSADSRGYSMRVGSHAHYAPHIYPYPYALPYAPQPHPYPYHLVNGKLPHPVSHPVNHHVDPDHLNRTWPPSRAAPDDRSPGGPGGPGGVAHQLPRVLSSPTNRKGRRALDPLAHSSGSAPSQARGIAGAGAGGSDSSGAERYKMPPLATAPTNGHDAPLPALQNGSVERIVLADDASSRALQTQRHPAAVLTLAASPRPSLSPSRAPALGSREPGPGQEHLHGDSQLPPRQFSHTQQKPQSVRSTAPIPTLASPIQSHPLAPSDVCDASVPATHSTQSSGNTSANTSGSLVSIQNVSREASALTSGYDSSTDGDQVAVSQGGDGTVEGKAVGLDRSPLLGEEDEIYGDNLETLQRDVDLRLVEEEHVQTAAVSPDRKPDEAVHLEVTSAAKKQSVVRKTPVRPGRGVRVPLNRPRANTQGSLASSGGATSLANISLSSSLGNSTTSLFADSLPGFDNPRDALTKALQQLDSIEWEVTMQALQSMVRLVRHHPALIQGHLHVCCESLSRQVRNLRSQVARAACQASSHLFQALKRGMDAEAEDLSTALFNRTADTNKFLRADSNNALNAMTDSILPAKAVSAIVHKGCRHQNAVVRTAGARLLLRLVDRMGFDRIMSQPRETRDLLLLTSARLLMEGSLETRSYAKTLLRNLAQDHRLGMILVEIVPANIMRSIDKTLKSCLMRK